MLAGVMLTEGLNFASPIFDIRFVKFVTQKEN